MSRCIIPRMRQADRFVPIINIVEESKGLIVLGSPPPHRDKLKINAGGLSELLDMVGGGQDLVKLGFERYQNSISAQPSDVDQVAAVTNSTKFHEEESRKPRRITYDPSHQELKISIDYRDDETMTPAATAKNLSRKLTKALEFVPTEKYVANFEWKPDEKLVSGQSAELSMHTGRLGLSATTAVIASGIFYVINNNPRPLETLGIIAVVNITDVASDLLFALDLLNGKSVDEDKVWMATAIAEKPLRAFYPASFVHELVVPTANILAHNIKSSAPLLKSSGD